MGAFALMQRRSAAEDDRTRRTIRQQFDLQGFDAPISLETPSFELHVYPKQVAPSLNAVEFAGGEFCACVGTMIYKGRAGEAALRRFHEDFAGDGKSPLQNVIGHFCLIIRKAATTYLVLDRLGIYKVYRNRPAGVWSSSFLTCAAVSDSLRPDIQSVYEYVFQGATYGNSTVLQQVDIVDPLDEPVLEGESRVYPWAQAWPSNWDLQPTQWDVESQLRILRAEYEAIKSAFGDHIDTALSGGYDSRLTLALLLEQGIRPRVHVYGRESDPDVRIAKQIDSAMHLGMTHIDKSRERMPDARQAADVVMENFRVMDGLPSDGVFSSGADLKTRRARCQDGCLALNGGGGEIYRNFFYLPDRPFSVRQILWTFYSRFDPRICTGSFSERDYYRLLGHKVCKAVKTDGETLTRQQVELVYPLFRCRYWMGKNNAVNNRLGPAMTPFIEFETVRAAAAIPLLAKQFGAFEGEMIRQVNKPLAGHDSAYGHDFMTRPPLRHRLSERLVYMRPPRVRRYIYRLKSRAGGGTRPPMLASERLSTVINVEFPCMRQFIHVDAVRDWEQLNRICTLELLFQQFG